jgi:hypothetical protein
LLARFTKRGVKPMLIGGATGEGVRDMRDSAWRMVDGAKDRG